MKTKTTIKAVRQSWKTLYYCGYCELEDIMRYKEPTYYNCGVYGWNCDVYTDYLTDIAITTGYRNMTGKQIPAELIAKYSNIAKEIKEKFEWTKSYEETKEAFDENRRNFFDELAKI